MSVFWPSKTLAEVCEIKPPKSEAKRKLKDGDSVSFVPMEDLGIDQKFLEPKSERKLGLVAGSYTYFADGDVLLAKITPCFENGKLGIARGLTNRIGFGSSEYIVFRPSGELSNEYLYYFLLQESFRVDGIRTMSGAVGHKRVSKEFIERCQIPLPPLSEQRHIVAILDKAFARLAAATTNAEKNLKNARELFDSYVNAIFAAKGKDWIDKTLAKICTFENGDRGKNYPSRSARSATGVPFINAGHLTGGGIDIENLDFIPRERFNLLSNGKIKKDDILFCLRGSLGKYASVGDLKEGAIASSLVIVRPEEGVSQDFLLLYFGTRLCANMIAKYSNGAAQPNLSARSLGEFEIPIPPTSEQSLLVEQCRQLRKRIGDLRLNYQAKIDQITKLKQSILQEAFSGELASQRIAAPIKRPTNIVGISATDLHAGIIAIAYQKHQGHPKQNTFGHVKAEKIAHMVEARVGLDLGRNPVKDAAGPNDYPHLMKVEHRANMAGYFAVKRLADGPYAFSKKNKFDDIVRKSRLALSEYNQVVDEVIDMMLPMDTEQAEILATVFAAWNNLLLDGRSPVDETIVREARENWHPDKLKIDRKRFLAALEWMRKNNVIPKGEGKKVVERAKE